MLHGFQGQEDQQWHHEPFSMVVYPSEEGRFSIYKHVTKASLEPPAFLNHVEPNTHR